MSAQDELAVEGDSEDDFDWEEVDVMQQAPMDISLDLGDDHAGPSVLSRPNIEITIQARPKPDEAAK